MDYQRIRHPIPPLYDKESRILILGSFPSVKSREAAFFYGHPQNRFWKLLAALFSEDVPVTVEEKSAFLHRNHVAVWDTIASCEIQGSSDSSIKNVQVNDLSVILDHAPIERIYCNGAKSHEYYRKYIQEKTGTEAVKLPSTSPANAAFGLEKLMDHWRQILIPLRIAPAGIGRSLLSWYDFNERILPWRSDPTPYHVWISEIMLQQTRVEAVKDYYDRWMQDLPDIPSLAGVSDEKLMKLWEGLGYYNRARNLKEAAITIMEKYGGQLPCDYEELLSLKGIGSYTAGAIASIAFGQPRAAVDGNVLRIFSRILMEPGKINSARTKGYLEREVLRTMPRERPGDYNQSLMDLGATVCLPNGQPLCEKCPWESICRAHNKGTECDYPVKEQKRPRRVEERAVFLIEWEGKYLLHKRERKGLLAGLWELPNLEGRYTLEKAGEEVAARGFYDYILEPLGEGKHIFSHVEWHMTGYRVRLQTLTKRLRRILDEDADWTLATRRELEESYALPSAFDRFKKQIDNS